MKTHAVTHSSEETQGFGRVFAQELTGGSVVALQGDLGAGKTTFVQGVIAGLGVSARVISPTFVVMREYAVPNTKLTVYHLDLYRMSGEADIKAFDLPELAADPNAILLIEWPEKVVESLPLATHQVMFTTLADDAREITISESSNS